MKKKVEQGGHVQILHNLRKFRTCPELPDILDVFAKSKLKINYFKKLLQLLSTGSMTIKMKASKINCMKKKTKNQSKDNNFYHIQEYTKTFNATIRSFTFSKLLQILLVCFL